MKYLVLTIGLALIAGCTESQQVILDPSFSTDIQTVFNTNCITCHGSGTQDGSYRLDGYAEVLGNGSDSVPNVIPSQADSSLLYDRINVGTMPPTGPLDVMVIQTVKNWINKGAQDN